MTKDNRNWLVAIHMDVCPFQRKPESMKSCIILKGDMCTQGNCPRKIDKTLLDEVRS